ncbi:MAG: patatin-like phospholipase family protein [Turneriella sp.]|nr:patatin-like phospholipase family protein [Turneriella sp.]
MKNQKLREVVRQSLLFRNIGKIQLGKILRHFHILQLHKGDYLFRAEQRSRRMYIVTDGKLRVEKTAATSPETPAIRIAALTAGDIVGEVAILTGERHSGQVRALTDATLVAISKQELAPLLRRYPTLLQNLTRIEAMRLRHNIGHERESVRELGFILHLYFTTLADYRAAESTTTALLAHENKRSLFIMDKDVHKFPTISALRRHVSGLLLKNPSIYLAVNSGGADIERWWAMVQMADRLVITLSEDPGSVTKAANFLNDRRLNAKVSLLNPMVITMRHAARENLVPTEIEEILRLGVRFRLKMDKDYWEKDKHPNFELKCRTIARAISDSTQGIAFGGGGARALSEIGVVSVLERHGIHFDHVAGTSMGALIATFYAQGLSSRQMSQKFREFLPDDSGLLRYNLPFISFFRDRSVNRILQRLFGRLRIEDLPIPLTIIAADLISGQEIRIQKGLVWRAIRASMSLPVIFAPVRYHGHYLVDGGAINNVPGNVLRDQGVGRVLGINCTPLEDDAIKEYLSSTNLFQLLRPGGKFWRNLKRFLRIVRIFFTRPPILQIANRAMMLEGSELIRQKSGEFDILLSPDVARFGLFEFDRREEIIDAGRHYARAQAADLRRLFGKSPK